MGLIIMKANKKFQSNRLLRIVGISGPLLDLAVNMV